MMPAYLIADIEIDDPARYARYRELASASVKKYGGRYLVRGGPHETVEGDWEPGRIVVLEFEDMDALRRWYDSEDYRQAAAIRTTAAHGSFVFVDGATT
jgi:uncharacterized protein (DUF1330 family)